MTKLSTEDILDRFVDIAPYLNPVMAEDVGISVIKGDRYVLYLPAETLDLGIKAGDPIKSPAVQQAIDSGKRVVQTFTRETSKFGVAYVASALPMKEGERVVGCLVVTQPIATQEKLKSVANDLAASAEEMTAGMEELSSRAAGLSATSRELDSVSNTLSDATRKTDEIVSFIKTVANQTNLLGLNAAIEAARVGDLGRGFGVVAEEVRKLAAASSESVKTIAEALNNIHTAIQLLAEKAKNIDLTVSGQVESAQSMTDASQSLAAMAAQLSELADSMYKTTPKTPS
ncbi:MAG: methyl-accepting chemotaxis protein [Negativicutes bacterium]|nr:methyl-accepting chemotaxis protein [Negativicutes bacterium]